MARVRCPKCGTKFLFHPKSVETCEGAHNQDENHGTEDAWASFSRVRKKLNLVGAVAALGIMMWCFYKLLALLGSI